MIPGQGQSAPNAIEDSAIGPAACWFGGMVRTIRFALEYWFKPDGRMSEKCR